VKGSKNRSKQRTKLGKIHLKISRQRQDHAIKLALDVIKSNDLVAYEDLRVKNMVKNHCLAKSINDAGWYQFRTWLEYFGKVFGRVTIAVNPAYTSQECSSCGTVVKKSLSTRTHACRCGCQMDRDHNAAVNILTKGIGTVGHTGTWGQRATHGSEVTSDQREALDSLNASGESTSILVGVSLPR
jgi:putative transposase